MRVILGVDGSEPSLVAQRLLVGAAWPRPLEVTLVSAYERPMDWSGTVALSPGAADPYLPALVMGVA